ncbi:MAG TPA: DUF4215 domain-containing protein [Candidatus Limnocylindrales bacterium]|nr:DUF4215 domain-containing protein [Candidatus Limnocylindrales bacterium]
MKSARASVLATLFFALAAVTPWAAVDLAQAQPIFRTPELACSQGIGASGRRYIEQVLAARIRCQARAIKGIIDPATNCRSGEGDEKLQQALRSAQLKLSHSLPVHCAGVDLTKLDFPGVCTDSNGAPFDTLDLEDCIVAETDEIAAALLGMYYPPIDDFFRGFKSICLRGTPLHGFKMFRGDIRSRGACTIRKALHQLDEDVDCRNDIPTWGPGTGDELVDAQIRRSYLQLLGGIPIECANFNIDDLHYQDVCPDGTGGIFTIFDLKECIFNATRPQTQNVINLLFPTDPVCGNGRLEPTEECDSGTGNSDTTPDACRTNCQAADCGDGTTDTGEQCDDGNTIETDDCTSECVPGQCGDGVKQGNEECDNGVNNSDTTPDACRLNCHNPSCGDGVTDPSFGDEECDDGNKSSNDDCSSTCKIEFCGDGIKQTSEQCDTSAAACNDNRASCSSGCECQLPCPGSGELTLFAGYGQECNTNADCPVGTCDKANSGRCKSVTALDSGWTGLAHEADINNLVVTRGFIECDATSAPCGVCELAGIDPANRNCRCRSNNQAICDQPFEADADDCGGETCDCYFGAPFPLSSGGTPACIVNRFFEDVSGTANVDLGAGAITANLRTQVFLGIETVIPCPMCGGRCSENPSQLCVFDDDCTTGTCNDDPVRDDGVRGGVCIEGRNAGTACDVNGINTTFPGRENQEPGGAGYSIDCFPDTGKNVSGSGLTIQLTQTTGAAELGFEVPCGNGDLLCPCRVCTSDNSVPCDSNADCASQPGTCQVSNKFTCGNNADCASVDTGPCLNPGIKRCDKATSKTCTTNADCVATNLGSCNLSSCSANGSGVFPQPNDCEGNQCNDQGNGEGECATGPDTLTCDGIIRPNGKGILTCNTNEDCSPAVVGRDVGNCTIVERRKCFTDPIVASGDPDPSAPVGAATFCIPPTSNSGINSVAGLPGPGRVTNQARSRTFCESDPTRQYQPGIGGCTDD